MPRTATSTFTQLLSSGSVGLFNVALSPFLIGRTFVREPSWEYSSNCDEAIFGVQKASLSMFWEQIRPVRQTLPLIGLEQNSRVDEKE